MWKWFACVLFAGLGVLCAPLGSARAAEGAAGFYLLGSKTTMAGYLPPPGTYLQDYNYIYSGSTDFSLNIAGLTLNGGVDADVYYNLITPLWVAPGEVLGGNIGFLVLVPIGSKDVSAGATIPVPALGVTLTPGRDDSETRFGDPVPGVSLGWHEGNWNWTLGTLINVPLGYWQRGNLANIGFNRWGVDLTGAFTWLDPEIGLEISSAAGFTFNGENPDTDYTTGTEFHFEYAVVQNFSKAFGIGVNGYFYDQVTGDSGAGARLGPFEGRVAGIGPVANLNFAIGKLPVTTSLKYFHEFDVKNRLEGDSGFVTVTMPLSAPPAQ
ncbi:transporter [Methyloligella sp. GL2]|uniref:SphA family protein n=2 Tax=unclassified Methyloligella TaxID=2625955 RepID=UPI00157D01F4|nr:transporter [Methyloligella sp. GL2]QKP76536.1 transporter [Methyloligella sp. GL2]